MPLLASKNKLKTSCKKFFAFCSFFLFSLLLSAGCQAAAKLSIDNYFTQVQLQPFLDILLDNQRQYSIADVTSPPAKYHFTPLQNSHPDNQKRLWLRFEIGNASLKQQHLWLNFSSLKYSDIAVFKSSNKHPIQQLAVANNIAQASQLVNLAPGEQAQFYLRLDNSPRQAQHLSIMSSAVYVQHLAKASQWKNASLSGLIVLFVLILFLAIKNRQKPFIFLLCYISALLLAELFLLNIQWQWLTIDIRQQIIAITLLFFICHGSGMLAVASFIQKRGRFKHFFSFYVGLLTLIALTYLLLALALPYFHAGAIIPACLTTLTIWLALIKLSVQYKDGLAAVMLLTRVITSAFYIAALVFYLDVHNLTSLGHHAVLSAAMLDIVSLLILLMLHQSQEQKKYWQQQHFLQNKPHENLNHLLRHNSQQMLAPINTIGQTLELLKTQTLDKASLALIENIRIANQNLANLSNELIHRTSSNDQVDTSQQTPFELPLLIEECLASQQPILLDKNIEIISDIDEAISPIVQGNSFYLQKILNILLQNAITYTQEGTIYLNVQALSESNDYLLFSVRDTGRGIDKQSLKTLRQYDSENPSSNLQLVQLLLQQMHSQLTMTSKLGEGSEFSFQIHMPASKLTQPINHNDFSQLAEKQLLIVDDNQTFSRSLQQQISRWGLQVFTSFDGIEAVAMFRAKLNLGEYFDFIILDNDTQNLSGIEVARRITQESQAHKKPRIILLASALSMPNEHLCRHVGIDLRLHKPLSQRLLKNALFTLLQQPIQNSKANKTVRLLVAEDNDISRKVISKMLQLLQIDSKVVNDGQLAVEACRRERFDLILMDCEMPILNGFQASIEILAWQKKQHQVQTPIIALTAHVSDEQKQAAQQAGMIGFLEKPIKIEDLTQLIEQHL